MSPSRPATLAPNPPGTRLPSTAGPYSSWERAVIERLHLSGGGIANDFGIGTRAGKCVQNVRTKLISARLLQSVDRLHDDLQACGVLVERARRVIHQAEIEGQCAYDAPSTRLRDNP